MRFTRWFVVCALVLAILAGCGGDEVEPADLEGPPTAEASPTLVATITEPAPASPTPADAPTSPAAATPTAAASPTVAAAPTPEATPTAEPTATTAAEPTEEATPTAVATPAVEGTPTAEASPTAAPEATATAETTPTAGPGTGVAEEPPARLTLAELEGLDTLDAYRVNTDITWTLDSGPQATIGVHTEAVAYRGVLGTERGFAEHWSLSVSQNGQRVEAIEFVTFADRTWAQLDGQFEEVAVHPEQLLEQLGWVGAPQQFLRPDAEGRFIGTETLDGMQTWHYRFGYGAFATEELGFELDSGEADVWISPEHGIAVRTRVRAVGADEEGQTGVLEVDSRVTDINEEITFDLPEELADGVEAVDEVEAADDVEAAGEAAAPSAGGAEAPPALQELGIPLMEGATLVQQAGPGVVVYQVDASPEEVIAYYTEELERLGWTPLDDGDGAAAGFRSEGNGPEGAIANVLALPGSGADARTTVVITVQR